MSDENKNKWDYEKQGVDQESADAASRGVNKPGTEVLKEAWNNVKDVFSGTARANTLKQNKRRNDGGYPGNR